MNHNEDFPTSHLTRPPDGTKATVLLAVGSYSPPTNAHLRLLVAAHDTLSKTHFVSGAFISPVSNAFGKPSLVSCEHRINMCRAALADIPWAAVTPWEARQAEFVRTYRVVGRLLIALREWAEMDSRDVEISLVCGKDLRTAMSDVSRWPPEGVTALEQLVHFTVKDREVGSEPSSIDNKTTVKALDTVVEPWVGDLSSTTVREHVKKGWSILFMTPTPVVEYIQRHKLFK